MVVRLRKLVVGKALLFVCCLLFVVFECFLFVVLICDRKLERYISI